MRMTFLAAVPVLMIAGSAAVAQSPATIDVHLSNFKFAPSTIVLKQGQPYVLRLINDGGGGHDFTAPEFFARSALAQRDRTWVQGGAVEVPGHQVREIHLTAPRAGSYKLKCSHTFHKAFGMSGRIIVR